MKNLELEVQILEKIEKMRVTQKAIDEINSLEIPSEPNKKKAYTLTEYQGYFENCKDYNRIINLKTTEKLMLENLYKQIVEEIVQSLPSGNIWFKIGNFYVAYETDDWPMSKPTFLLQEGVEESVLPTLVQRHIKG